MDTPIKSNYLVVSVSQLASMVTNDEKDGYYFCTSFPDVIDETVRDCDFEDWHGVRRTNVFGNEVVVASTVGCGHVQVCEIDDYSDDEDVQECIMAAIGRLGHPDGVFVAVDTEWDVE